MYVLQRAAHIIAWKVPHADPSRLLANAVNYAAERLGVPWKLVTLVGKLKVWCLVKDGMACLGDSGRSYAC